ncbi:MAG: hypothetical protein NC133_00065 [Prevotella sp.]|nr:hypothetical protein [Prevotella sp.]
MVATIVDDFTIQVSDLSQFDPYAILHSGQVFRYWQTEQGWLVMSGHHWAEMKMLSGKMMIECDDAQYFYHYFDFATDYQSIKQTLTAPKLQNALVRGGGIRILQADFVEIVLSFIISANNNIKRFTKTINDICAQYGTLTPCGHHSFPTLAQCATITAADFKRLGCGYRDQYLAVAVQQLKNLDFAALQRLSNADLQRELLKIQGVGPKVAACIMLFAFHRLDTAPVDTWIQKAIAQLAPDEQQTILHGQYAGIAQQYIFYYLQHLHREVL